MAVDAFISDTAEGAIFGGIGNISNYSVVQEATPISGVESTSATPYMTLSAQQRSLLSAIRLRGATIVLDDTENRGVTTGIVDSVTLSEDSLEIGVASLLAKMVGRVILPPFNGTLGAYIDGLLLRVDDTILSEYRGGIGTIPIVIPAMSGTGWEIITELCVAHQIEVVMQGTMVSFRPVRGAEFTYDTIDSYTHTIESGRRARYIEAHYYNTEWDTNGLIYPRLEDRVNANSYPTAGANQKMTVEYRLNGVSVATVSAPQCVSGATNVDSLGSSCYTVLDRDNIPVDPAWWVSAGGAVTVTTNEEADVLRVVFITPNDRERSPFSLARLDADGNPSLSLRVYGSGAFMTEETLLLNTGAEDSDTLEEVGATVDSRTYATRAQAVTAAARGLLDYSSSIQTLSASISMPKLVALSAEWASVIFNELNLQVAGLTYTAFNALFAGMTFQQFNDSLDDTAMERFSEQLFSVLVGGRIKYAHSYFRITNVTFSPDGIDIDAVADTTAGDIESLWSGYTWAQLEPLLESMTWEEWEAIPLVMTGL